MHATIGAQTGTRRPVDATSAGAILNAGSAAAGSASTAGRAELPADDPRTKQYIDG